MKWLLVVLAAFLSGCASLDGAFTNRVSVTVASDECQVASRWGKFSIGTDIDPRDCEAIRRGMVLHLLMLMQSQRVPDGTRP